MENKLIKEHHYFLLTDYEKEENFLREKHKQGYKFVKSTPLGTYYFEKCEPKDVVYKLDFNPQKTSEMPYYLRMYEDYGWEYIQDLNEYSYFRKSAVNKTEPDTEIFSDNDSRLRMLKHIFKRKMIPLTFFFLYTIIMLITQFNFKNTEPYSSFRIMLILIWCVLFLFYIFLWGHCAIGFYHLKKKYSSKSM